MLRIDSHQHFWSIARGDYGWLTPDLPPVYRDFLPRDLRPLLRDASMDATVLVQAAPSIAETDFLLSIADETDFVAKVVGWIDMEDRSHLSHLHRFAKHPKFAGRRPMVQDQADPDWILRPALAWAFDAMTDLGLTFDALGFPVHGQRFLRVFEKHPDLKAVVDHGLKPDIRGGAFSVWADEVRRIAQNTNATCKLSGLVTEAGRDCTPATLRPYIACILDAFGADRTMWGSDWPVLNLASGYAAWHKLAIDMVPDAQDRDKIFGGTATRFYGIFDLSLNPGILSDAF
jgi:L-fuconolactonase